MLCCIPRLGGPLGLWMSFFLDASRYIPFHHGRYHGHTWPELDYKTGALALIGVPAAISCVFLVDSEYYGCTVIRLIRPANRKVATDPGDYSLPRHTKIFRAYAYHDGPDCVTTAKRGIYSTSYMNTIDQQKHSNCMLYASNERTNQLVIQTACYRPGAAPDTPNKLLHPTDKILIALLPACRSAYVEALPIIHQPEEEGRGACIKGAALLRALGLYRCGPGCHTPNRAGASATDPSATAPVRVTDAIDEILPRELKNTGQRHERATVGSGGHIHYQEAASRSPSQQSAGNIAKRELEDHHERVVVTNPITADYPALESLSLSVPTSSYEGLDRRDKRVAATDNTQAMIAAQTGVGRDGHQGGGGGGWEGACQAEEGVRGWARREYALLPVASLPSAAASASSSSISAISVNAALPTSLPVSSSSVVNGNGSSMPMDADAEFDAFIGNPAGFDSTRGGAGSTDARAMDVDSGVYPLGQQQQSLSNANVNGSNSQSPSNEQSKETAKKFEKERKERTKHALELLAGWCWGFGLGGLVSREWKRERTIGGGVRVGERGAWGRNRRRSTRNRSNNNRNRRIPIPAFAVVDAVANAAERAEAGQARAQDGAQGEGARARDGDGEGEEEKDRAGSTNALRYSSPSMVLGFADTKEDEVRPHAAGRSAARVAAAYEAEVAYGAGSGHGAPGTRRVAVRAPRGPAAVVVGHCGTLRISARDDANRAEKEERRES
ncbi:hypothetical protein C8R46DRAFT_1024872 [Mycena filopes]|nr:hypothetical protein C8R46DRAFT_1024872 [Mycena filopes]